MTAETSSKKPSPEPPGLGKTDPRLVTDTQYCQQLIHANMLLCARFGIDGQNIIAALESELNAWRDVYPSGA